MYGSKYIYVKRNPKRYSTDEGLTTIKYQLYSTTPIIMSELYELYGSLKLIPLVEGGNTFSLLSYHLFHLQESESA